MERSVFKFIYNYSKTQQIFILLITAISLPFYYVSLDIPKKIINGALDPGSDSYLKPLDLFGVEIVQLDRLPLLFTLCGIFLVLVVINGGFKYYINVYRGKLGERMLRRLRYLLYGRILRFPLAYFRKVSQGELIPMITAEIEPLGGFIGDAFALPALQGGLLVTALVFIMAQDWRMGVAAIASYPFQMYVIPKLQFRVNMLGKARVREVRKLSERIGETVSGAQEIHANDTSNFELADFSYRLGRIYDIRYQIYRKKFFMKFLNNFLNQLTPFFFFAIGGYLVIAGNLSLGALVAVLAAYKDLAPPWKELLNYYQRQADATIKYEQVVSQFAPPGIRPAEQLEADVDKPEPLSGELAAANLSLTDDDVKVVDAMSFTVGLDERVAVVGAGSSGKEELLLLLARLIDPTGGRVTVGDRELQELPEAVTGRRIAFVAANTHLNSASLGDNLFYGLKHRPLRDAEYDEATAAERRAALAESAASGNTPDDVFADWIDYESAGVESGADLVAAGIRALGLAEMIDDCYQLGLRGTIDPAKRADVADRILQARAALRDRLAEPDLANLVEHFDVERYNTNATVAENLLFGTPVGDAFDLDHLADNPHVRSVLDGCGLVEDLLRAGHEVASTMVELFSDLPPEHEFFEQFGFISADDLPEYKDLLGRVDRDSLDTLNDEERHRLLSLPFMLIPARHRLDIIDEPMQARLLEARAAFAETLPDALRGAVEFFDAERYNAASTLQDNILFGKLAYGQAQAEARIGGLISEVIDDLGLRDTVIEVGLDFEVGIAGGRLSSAQRQKLAIARAVLKRPDVLIISEATATLDGATQNKIMANLLEEFKGRALIWALHRPSAASQFDRVIVLRAGRIVEQGEFGELDRPDSYLTELIAAE
ncbi:MAG: ATP-binding cassette domain-containing protein [Proteobacteria bacterium]|nr:ATP-binding cassette domain-containing protein [Pseudomonadota bacterium]